MANPRIIITGDSTDAVAAVKRLRTELGSLQSASAKALGFGGAISSAAVVAGLVSITKAVIDQGDALNKLSQSTGIAVEDLSKLQYAADLSGVSAEALKKGLVALSVDMAAAASGAGPAAEKYAKFGISVRNADGTIKSSLEILGELADRFQAMPDGVEKTNLAVDVFGKRLSADMIPLLNLGSEGLKAMADEAQNLGLVMSGDLAKKSEEFNDNVERLSKLAGAAGISIAQSLIPSLNVLLTEYIDAERAGLSFLESLTGIGLSNPFKDTKEKIADIGKELESLKQIQKLGGSPFPVVTDEEIAKLEKLQKYYQLQSDRQTGDGIQSADQLASKKLVREAQAQAELAEESKKRSVEEEKASEKRLAIESKMQTKLAELAKLRAVAEGQASADILKTDSKRIADEITNVEKLRDASKAAYKEIIDSAAKARTDAAGFRSAGADIKGETKQQADAIRNQSLSPEDKAYLQSKALRAAEEDASFSSASARAAVYNRTPEQFNKLAESAQIKLQEALKLATEVQDATRIEDLGAELAALQNSRATVKDKEAANLDEQAAAQAATFADLDQQVTSLQAKAASIQINADISAAESALATLQSKLDGLQDRTVTVNVVTKNEGASSDASAGFARGGYTGPGGKWQPAGIVHADEFVLRKEVVRQTGAIAFLARFNREGMAALRRNGYAAGGLVSRVAMPQISRNAAPGSSSNAVFNFPGMGSFQATLAPDVMSELKTAFSREALKKGGRR